MGTEDDKDAAKSSLPLWAKPSAFLRQRFPSLKTRVPVADDDASFGNELREWWRKTKERCARWRRWWRWRLREWAHAPHCQGVTGTTAGATCRPPVSQLLMGMPQQKHQWPPMQ